jgi:hypothetical protein
MHSHIRWFKELGINDVSLVAGKNASLGEMYQNLNPSLRNSPAINHAAALAKASGASLHIAAFVRPLEILSLLDEGVQERGRESYLQDHRDWLKNQATNLHALGLEVTTEVTWADDMKQDACDLSGVYLTDMGGWRLQTSPKSCAQPRNNRSSNWPVGTASPLTVGILFSVTRSRR